MKGGVDLGDGLNTLSNFPFTGFARSKWNKCNGYVDSSNDCLTPKGFSRFVVDLGAGREVDFYDVTPGAASATTTRGASRSIRSSRRSHRSRRVTR